MHLARLVALLSVCVLLAACGQAGDTGSRVDDNGGKTKSLRIYSVNYPLAWAAEQLLGEDGQVSFPAPAGVDPAFWQPDVATISAYQQADIVLLNGANFARWVPRVSLAENRLLDASRAFQDRFIALDRDPVHSHGPEGQHSHGEVAFTLWLDLSLYGKQVDAIAAALGARQPRASDAIASRHRDIVERIATLDAALQGLGQDFNGAPILYSHPVYQYFNRRYNFNGRSVHWEPDQPPSDRDWSQLRGLLQQHRAGVMLWEAEPLRETRDKLAALGVVVVVFQPMANRPAAHDFHAGMVANIERLREAVP